MSTLEIVAVILFILIVISAGWSVIISLKLNKWRKAQDSIYRDALNSRPENPHSILSTIKLKEYGFKVYESKDGDTAFLGDVKLSKDADMTIWSIDDRKTGDPCIWVGNFQQLQELCNARGVTLIRSI